MSKFNSYIGNKYTINKKEVFSWEKFSKIFSLGSSIEWVKSIKEIIDLRKLLIYLMIASLMFGYGYWKGQQGLPIKVDIGYEEAVEIEVPNSNLKLYKPANSSRIYWKDKQGNKSIITVGDIPGLQKKLKPISFQFKPIGILGIGSGLNGSGFEAGAGISFLRYWKWRLETFFTNSGLYIATSYKLKLLSMQNSSLGIGVGRGYEGEDRTILYYRWKF